jgi:hypothetical protein
MGTLVCQLGWHQRVIATKHSRVDCLNAPIKNIANRLSYFKGPVIEVHVGKGDSIATFMIHKELAMSRSPFFANALRKGSPWASATDGVINLQEEDPEMFALYAQLIYHDSIPTKKNLSKIWSDMEKKAKGTDGKEAYDACAKHIKTLTAESTIMLAKLYVFCEMMLDLGAKDRVKKAFVEQLIALKDLIIRESIPYPCSSAITIVFNGTYDSDPLRAYFVEVFAQRAGMNWFEDSVMNDYPRDFCFQVMKLLSGRRPW